MSKSNWDGLKRLQKKMKKLEQTKTVSFDKLFSTSFMKKYTSFSSINEFFEKGDFEFETEKDFENISEEKLDTYVSSTTNFSSWGEMKAKAGEVWVAKELEI